MLSEEICIIGSDWPNKLSYAKRKKRTGVKKFRSGRESHAYRWATIATVTPLTSSLNRHTRRFNPRAWPFTWFNSRTRQEVYLFSWKIKLPKRFPDTFNWYFSYGDTLFSSSILQELDYDRSPDFSFTSPGRIPLRHHCYGKAGYESGK